jgi:hypothetical protein
MVRCLYPETIHDEKSDMEVYNDKYICWHEGYEAHKFEMANLLMVPFHFKWVNPPYDSLAYQ